MLCLLSYDPTKEIFRSLRNRFIKVKAYHVFCLFYYRVLHPAECSKREVSLKCRDVNRIIKVVGPAIVRFRTNNGRSAQIAVDAYCLAIGKGYVAGK